MSTGVGWGRAAQAYAETFAPLCAGVHDAVLEAAGHVAGGRVLDVGCGDGRLAARLVRSGPDVTAVDPDPEMLTLTAAAAPQTERIEAALPDLPFDDPVFDAVYATFVVNHLGDPRAGVRELARVAVPGAPVVVTIWPSGRTVQGRMWQRVLDDAGVVPPAGTRLPEHLDFARTSDGLAGLLDEAGLVDVDARPVGWTHRADVDSLWRGAAAGLGGIGATVVAQPPDVRAALRRAYDRHVSDLVVDGALQLEAEAVLAVGRRAGGGQNRKGG